jgi:hypothetical protein
MTDYTTRQLLSCGGGGGIHTLTPRLGDMQDTTIAIARPLLLERVRFPDTTWLLPRNAWPNHQEVASSLC